MTLLTFLYATCAFFFIAAVALVIWEATVEARLPEREEYEPRPEPWRWPRRPPSQIELPAGRERVGIDKQRRAA